MYKIVVHPGRAHRDDLMAVCVLLAAIEAPVEVLRREPSSEDLADPDIYVVDIGMDYDPGRHNFDHHQDPSLPCAFHLVMKHLGYHDDAVQMFGWYPFMSMMDVQGPHKTAEYFGVDASVFFVSSSPIEGYVLSQFSPLTSLQQPDLLYQLMKELGQDLFRLIEMKKKRLARLKEEAAVVPVKHVKAVVSRIADNPKLAMELYLRFLADDSLLISITPSARGDGWELLRLGDNGQVDFREISDCPEIRFVHANGHVATTHSLLPLPKVIELAARSTRSI
jgi:hypothetical protein